MFLQYYGTLRSVDAFDQYHGASDGWEIESQDLNTNDGGSNYT